MKKYLFLVAFFVAVQAQAEPALLERMEHLVFNPDLKTVFTQHYDRETQRLEVLSESEGEQSFRHKRVVQYDKDGKRIIHWEEFRWDNTTQQWLKEAKGHSDFAGSKETYTTYQGKNGEWIAYRKYEEHKDERSTAQVIYELSPKQQWMPIKKSYTLLHNNNKTAFVEEYDWDQRHSQWSFNSKIESIYDQNNEIHERLYFKGNDGKWIANLKTTYSQQADGNSTFIKWAWENGKWREQERDITEWDKSKRQKTNTNMHWDGPKDRWKNINRAETRYMENERVISDSFFKWDEHIQQWQTLSETTYDYDEQERISKQQNFYFSHNQEGRQTTYQYDHRGNIVEELIQQYDFITKSWHSTEKILYYYDFALLKQDVIDKDNIADEVLVPAVNVLIQKDIYHMKNQVFTLKEQVRFFYSKSPQNTENAPVKRYFRSNSDLHKQKSDKPTYLYDEITEQEALSNNQVAYFIGYYRNDVLLRYEKVYNGNTLLYKEIEQPKK